MSNFSHSKNEHTFVILMINEDENESIGVLWQLFMRIKKIMLKASISKQYESFPMLTKKGGINDDNLN